MLDAPLQAKATDTPWHSEGSMPAGLPPIDLLIVDGPPSGVARLARFPALPRLMPRMASGAVAMVDDADREDERKMVVRWREIYPPLTEPTRLVKKAWSSSDPQVMRSFRVRRSSAEWTSQSEYA